MNDTYSHIRSGGTGFSEQKRGLIAVWGKEAVQFLDGMITNDMKTLEDRQQMLAAFPNAQGRLIAVVRVRRMGDRYLFDTEEATHDVLFQTLHRFTFAGEFFVGDTSDLFRCFEVFGSTSTDVPGGITFERGYGSTAYIPNGLAEGFVTELKRSGAQAIDDDLYELLRVEAGSPKFGVDMDETTIVPELGLHEMISYTKGCYIGQEIIARIHFRGHVAKMLSGVTADEPLEFGGELTVDGRNAGKIASTAFSPSLEKHIALAFVRYDHLAQGTVLNAGNTEVVITKLPFT